MDEPFDGLDPKSKQEIIDYLNLLNRERGMTLITTTHDIDLVPQIADTVYVLTGGNIVLRGNPIEVFSNTDVLKRASLEPPILMELFRRLSKRGYDMGTPIDLDEAEGKLVQKFKGIY